MKKYFKYLFLTIGMVLGLASCSKDEIPMTSTVDLAGEWMMTDDMIVNGTSYGDYYGAGQWMLITYNTNKNDGLEIWVDDLKNFWDFKIKVPCTIGTLSFGSDAVSTNEYYDSGVTIKNGKITLKGTTTPSGMPADAIEFDVIFDDDYDNTVHHMTGYRRTGFVADE